MKILVTGGAGFIGSALIRYLITEFKYTVINVDNLTYAGDLSNLECVSDSDLYFFEKADISNYSEMSRIINKHSPDKIMHLAAESHVDRSINESDVFIKTNIIGTYNLLEISRVYFNSLPKIKKEIFCFHHISTDEVYGDLESTSDYFTEDTPYAPSSPYSATKASSDHLVRAWFRTYDLPILITNCSNNYGPFQYPDKLIPLVILNAIKGLPIPVYGDGLQIRDWLYVDDHVSALVRVLLNGVVGETYNIGGNNELTNIDVVEQICELLEELHPIKSNNINNYKDLIEFIKDRPGHDERYAIDARKIKNNLKWSPSESFKTGIRKTVSWYLDNINWCEKN